MNLYSYVHNDPVNWVDPWGLQYCELAAGAGGLGVLNFTFSKAESVCGLEGSGYTSGGSLDLGLSLGADYNEAINSDNNSFSLNIGIGLGYPPGESHLFKTKTYLYK